MKAAPLENRPNFPLMTQADIVSFYHLQMPRWLFSHEKYKSLSLEAKVAYTFLLNRFQLSRLNGWINDQSEVFIIFPREALAGEMQVSYRKAIECFKELVAAGLIWERRMGRGIANQIYLAVVRLEDKDAGEHNSAPFSPAPPRPAKPAGQEDPCAGSRPADMAHQEVSQQQVKTCENRTSEDAALTVQDLPLSHTSQKEPNSKEKTDTEVTQKEVSPFVGIRPSRAGDCRTDDEELEQILENCELYIFPPEVAGVFQSAVERLYYSRTLTIGNAVLPREKIRSHLWELNGMILQDVLHKLQSNLDRPVKNSTAYVMSVIFNAIWESQSDLLVDPFLNSLQRSAGKGGGSC